MKERINNRMKERINNKNRVNKKVKIRMKRINNKIRI